MSFLLDDIACGGQIFCGAGSPIALGVGEAKIRGSAFIEGPHIIGRATEFPIVAGTVMISPLNNPDSPEPFVPGALCRPAANPFSLIVSGNTGVIGRLDVDELLQCGNDIVAVGEVKSQCGGHVLSNKKNFDIPHPTKEGWRLTHTCVEGPEAAVYIRGRVRNKAEILLPDYWKGLVDIDTITVNSYGDISLIKGKEARFAVPPQLETDKLAIAQVSVPGYPALSSKDADSQGKRQYAIAMKPTGIKNYTMKDLHSLEKKIDNMAYYISLNQLESDTQNITVLDENGLSRFKNGFIVDPFNNLSLADIGNPEFKAAVPFNQKILTPALNTFPLDLKYKSSTSSTIFPSVSKPSVATLTRDSNVDIIEQQSYLSMVDCYKVKNYVLESMGEPFNYQALCIPTNVKNVKE